MYFLPSPWVAATDRYILQSRRASGWKALSWGPNLEDLITYSNDAGRMGRNGKRYGPVYSDAKTPRRIIDTETDRVVWGFRD